MQTASPTTPGTARPIVGVCCRGGRLCGRHTTANCDLTAPNRDQKGGGNCTNRGATRRRHADRRLLVVQKPPLCLGGGGLGVDRGARWRGLSDWGRRGACGLGVTPFMPGHDGGNCTNRGATRRRHADRMLLMLQNPHRYPGVMLPHWYRTARLGSVGCRKGADDAPRRLGLTRDQCVASCHPDPPGTAHGHAVVRAGRDSPVMRASMAWSVALSIL